MLPYQERVVNERDDLKTKANALYGFLASSTFETLPKLDQELLKQQYYAMMIYIGILDQRIERFKWI